MAAVDRRHGTAVRLVQALQLVRIEIERRLVVQVEHGARVFADRAHRAFVPRAGQERFDAAATARVDAGTDRRDRRVAGRVVRRRRVDRFERERQIIGIGRRLGRRRDARPSLRDQFLDPEVGVEVTGLVVIVVREGAGARPDMRPTTFGIELFGRLLVQRFVDHRGTVFKAATGDGRRGSLDSRRAAKGVQAHGAWTMTGTSVDGPGASRGPSSSGSLLREGSAPPQT